MTPPVPATGSVLGDRYVLGALLGKGGMGHVYAARDRKLQREVAVKLMGAQSPDRDALRRFSREALAASALQHPNVLAVFDAGEDVGRPYLVTELLRGSTLRALLENGRLEAADALRFARQLASGLAAAHDKGFTHRDLKPENVFITEDGWAKILDFGLVKLNETLHVGPVLDGNPTALGRTLGTVGYMAPEQVRGQPVDARADIFNFGLVLYEMLSGERAFKGNTSTEMGYAILFDDPKPLPNSVPRWLRTLVEACLAKDREARPSTARELLDALQNKSAKKPARKPLPPLVPILLLLIAAAGAVVFYLRNKPQPPGVPTVPAVKPTGSVAILPFDAREAPNFTSLAEGVSDLLSRDFAGGHLHAAETASVLRVFANGNAGDFDKARMAAQQLGARYFVLGRIQEDKGKLRVEAVLHDADTGHPITQGVAQGPQTDILTVMRKISDALQGIAPAPAEFKKKLDDLAFQTSRSPVALQAWLDGERLYRHMDIGESADAFTRAVAADSQFALAHYKLGMVSQIHNALAAEEALERAVRYKDRLSPPERLLAQGQLALQRGFFGEADRYFQQATQEFPGEGETWLALGEYQFHHGAVRGHSQQDAAPALQQALLFNPVETEAIGHLSDLALLRGERKAVANLVDRLLPLTDDPVTLAMHLRRAWAHRDQTEHDETMLAIEHQDMTTVRGKQGVYNAFLTLAWLMGNRADEELISRKVAGHDGFQLDAVFELMHGQPNAARATFKRASVDFPNGDTPFHGLWIESLTDFASTPAQIASARVEAQRQLAAAEPDSGKLPMLLYVSGVLAIRAGDAASAAAVASRLDATSLGTSSIPQDLALALRARILARRKKHAEALALLEKQKLRIPGRYELHYAYWKTGEWFLRAQLLEALGRLDEALPLYDTLIFGTFHDPIFAPIAHLHKARIYAAKGDTARAVEHYRAFADAWKTCEAAEKPLLESAERELARLHVASK